MATGRVNGTVCVVAPNSVCANMASLGSWTWHGLHPSAAPPEINPGGGSAAPQPGNATSKVGGELGPTIPIQQSVNEAVKPASEPEAALKEKQSGDTAASEETNETQKQEPRSEPQQEEKIETQKQEPRREPQPEEKMETEKQEPRSEPQREEKMETQEREPRSEPQDERKIEEANGPTGEEAVQTGDKRKADEVVVPEAAPSTEDKEAKKQKTTNGTTAEDDSKKEPEVSKPVEKKRRGPKKEKKVPRTGTAERKTRSQGAPPVAGL